MPLDNIPPVPSNNAVADMHEDFADQLQELAKSHLRAAAMARAGILFTADLLPWEPPEDIIDRKPPPTRWQRLRRRLGI